MFGERLKEIRESQGISQVELAHRSGVTQGHISQLEAGQRDPQLSTVRKLAAALGVPLDAISPEIPASDATARLVGC